MSLIESLHAIQKQISVPKNKRNNFGNYNYRNAEDILDAVKKLMPEGCAVTVSDEIVAVLDRVYVKATATFHLGQENKSVSAYAREPLSKKGADESQVTGSTTSYARKYALCGLFAIDDGIDEDTTNDHGASENTKKSQQKKSQPTKENNEEDLKAIGVGFEVETLRKMIAARNSSESDILSYAEKRAKMHLEKLEDIPRWLYKQMYAQMIKKQKEDESNE